MAVAILVLLTSVVDIVYSYITGQISSRFYVFEFQYLELLALALVVEGIHMTYQYKVVF